MDTGSTTNQDGTITYNGIVYPSIKVLLWDQYSRAMPEDTYDVEKEYAFVAGKSVMLEADFKEVLDRYEEYLSDDPNIEHEP